jgi:hypothetical protein
MFGSRGIRNAVILSVMAFIASKLVPGATRTKYEEVVLGAMKQAEKVPPF